MVRLTFNQVVSKLKQNKYATSSMWLPNPFKGTRRELVATQNCNNRAQTFENTESKTSLAYVTDPVTQIIINPSECCTPTYAALRTRSTGNRPKQFITDTATYLQSRGKTWTTDIYNFGDSIQTENSNILTTQHFKPGKLTRRDATITLSNQSTIAFQYQWLNGDVYDVVLQKGKHNLETVNLALRNTMFTNKHYLIDTLHQNKNIFFLRFVYDSKNNCNQIQCTGLDSKIYDASRYKPWTSYSTAVDWMLPDYTLVPRIIFNNAEFATALGFSNEAYPPQSIDGDYGTQPPTVTSQEQNYFANNSFYFANGDVNPTIKSKFVSFVYRPLNTYFAQNGAVSASAFVSKKKYNTVTNNAVNYFSGHYRRFDDSAITAAAVAGYSQKTILGFDDQCFTNCI